MGKTRAFLVSQKLKRLPAMRETWVRSLGWEDPLEKGTATHSSTLAWRIHGLYSPWGPKSQTRLSLSAVKALLSSVFSRSSP